MTKTPKEVAVRLVFLPMPAEVCRAVAPRSTERIFGLRMKRGALQKCSAQRRGIPHGRQPAALDRVHSVALALNTSHVVRISTRRVLRYGVPLALGPPSHWV